LLIKVVMAVHDAHEIGHLPQNSLKKCIDFFFKINLFIYYFPILCEFCLIDLELLLTTHDFADSAPCTQHTSSKQNNSSSSEKDLCPEYEKSIRALVPQVAVIG